MQGKEATAIYSNEKNPAENLNDNGGWSDFPSFNGGERSFIDPTGFEKPSDNYNTIASSVNEYIHCDLTKKGGFYQAVMTSGVQRWYPSLKSSQSPTKNQFENNRFEEWKQNIINLDPQTAIKKYGHGDTFNALKKLHNFFKSGQDASTQTEAINSCFKNDDTGFDIAFNELRYDRHSTPGWAYYSSRDEKIGLEKQIDANGRLYLNAEPIDTFDIAEKFIDACKDLNLPYEFKINRDPDRSDAMVIYVNNKSLGDYVSIISKILDENPEINQRIGEPPLLSEKISSKIGYGDEKVGTSYNNRQCEHFQEVIESTALSYRGPAPEEIQKRVRFLYVNQHEKFLKTIKERL